MTEFKTAVEYILKQNDNYKIARDHKGGRIFYRLEIYNEPLISDAKWRTKKEFIAFLEGLEAGVEASQYRAHR